MRHSRKREKVIYKYDCTLTNKSFKLTEKAPRPDDLVSVEGFYQLNPDKDDRPLFIKKQILATTPVADPNTSNAE